MLTYNADEPAKIANSLREALACFIQTLEAGRSFDHALYRYAHEHDNALARAFGGIIDDIVKAGKSRREALRDMADALDVPEVKAFTEAMIEADEKGISIVETLRQQVAHLN
jgi:tight adherence protein C